MVTHHAPNAPRVVLTTIAASLSCLGSVHRSVLVTSLSHKFGAHSFGNFTSGSDSWITAERSGYTYGSIVSDVVASSTVKNIPF